MKKAILLSLVVMIILSSATVGVTAATMYAPDGRTVEVKTRDIPSWQAVGWYSDPVMYVYAPDGRKEVIKKTKYEAWKAVGWYSDPVMYVYAPDGRKEVIKKTKYEAWKAVGWYKYPVMYVYAPDGRKETIKVSEFAQWFEAGWSNSQYYRLYTEWLDDIPASEKNRVAELGSFKTTLSDGKKVSHYIKPDYLAYGMSYSEVNNNNGSYVEYYLGKKYKFLSGTSAFRQETNIKGTAMIKIYADGKKIYESPAIDPKTEHVNFTVDVTGCKYLKIKLVALEKQYINEYGNSMPCDDYDEFIVGNLKLYRK